MDFAVLCRHPRNPEEQDLRKEYCTGSSVVERAVRRLLLLHLRHLLQDGTTSVQCKPDSALCRRDPASGAGHEEVEEVPNHLARHSIAPLLFETVDLRLRLHPVLTKSTPGSGFLRFDEACDEGLREGEQ